MNQYLTIARLAVCCLALCPWLHPDAICLPRVHKGPGGSALAETQKGVPQLLLVRSISDTARSPVDYVDPRIGVLDAGSNCVIGPQLPSGSINPSP